MERIDWQKNMRDAVKMIRGGTRLPMLFFYDPEEEGSMKLIAETLCDDRVIKIIAREFATVRYDTAESEGLVRGLHINLTPTFVITDDAGTELERWVGYLPAKELMAQVLLSKALAALHIERFSESITLLEELVDEHPNSELIPEAKYFIGAASYSKDGDNDRLCRISEELEKNFPKSMWTKRASVWADIGLRKSFGNYSDKE